MSETSSARPGGFLSAVVADSRATMPRRPVRPAEQDAEGPLGIAAERAPDFAARGTPAPPALAHTASRRSAPPRASQSRAVAADPVMAERGETFDPAAPPPSASGGHAGEQRAPAVAPTGDARIDATAQASPARALADRFDARPAEIDGGPASPHAVPPDIDGPPPDGRLQAKELPRPAPAEPVPGRSATRLDRTDIRAAAHGAADRSIRAPVSPKPAAAAPDARPRVPREGSERIADRASSGPPPQSREARAMANAAPPAVHIGTLDVRIEVPKPRVEPAPRQPVTFRGSGVLSRLYLRRV